MSPASEGGFLTMGPPGRSLGVHFSHERFISCFAERQKRVRIFFLGSLLLKQLQFKIINMPL